MKNILFRIASAIVITAAILAIILVNFGCSYIVPNSTNIEPAKTKISERTKEVGPPAQKYDKKVTVRIKRRGNDLPPVEEKEDNKKEAVK